MILLYTLLMLLLNSLKFLVSLRARRLERKFVATAAAVDQMLREPEYKPGNSSKHDPCLAAKKTLALGLLVQKRDRIEASYFAWQRWADRSANWVNAVRQWKGKRLPYTLGAVDVWMLLGLIDYLGVGQYCSTMAVIESIMQLWTN